ncbi:hypothetical protein [Streptomyces sp. NRRL F-5630]|uniref:hypothetical protein n=1 Tax=Streptomyces sp. NRRL F-5630 TaxID=1463864 RepID=UPI000ABD96BC|nr:hypothetical protein [Streptomyces sp. NRRL F-5630]
MILITGPQTTAHEREDLAEAAGLLGAYAVTSPDVMWAEVTAVYYLDGCDGCSRATADLAVARALGLEPVPVA